MADDLYAPPGTEQFDWPPRQGSALGVPPRTSGIESALGRRQAQRDLYDPTQFQPADGGQALTGTPVHQPGMLGDFGRQVLASTMQMGEGLLGAVSAANVALGGDPEMRAIVDKGRHTVADATRSVIESMSPKAQAAMQASLFGGTDRHGNETPGPGTVGWGSYIGATIASAIPTVVLAVIPGTVIGSAVGGMAATGTLFGAIQSGEAYNAFVDALDKATPQQLEQSEVYRELIGRGMSDTDARKEMLKTITPGLAAMQFGIGAATGVGYAHMLGKGLAGSALSRMGVGAAEGAALGALQGAGGNLASQRAEIQAGILGDYNLGDAAATGAAGALGGIILGGGAGALAGRRRPSALKEPPGRPVDVPADQAAALSEAGPIAPPRAPVQGEMFLPHEMGAGPRPGEAAGMPTQQPDLFGGPTVQVTERAPAFEHQGVRMTGDPSTAPMPPPQREMLPGAPEQRVPAMPDAVPPEMRQPPPEVPGQLDLPLQPQTIRLYRGEGAGGPVMDGSPTTGGWFTTDVEKAKRYGAVRHIDVTRDDMMHFAQGHGGPDEWVTTNPKFINAELPAPAPRRRATQGEPTAAQPQEQVASPPAAPVAPAAPAPATRRPSVAPEQGASAPKAAEPVKSEPPAAKSPPETTTVVAPKKPRLPEVIRRWAEGTTVKAEDGEPLRVYHGTKSDIREFDASKRGAHTKAGSAQEAFFFTDHPGVAGEYADKAPVVGNAAYRKRRDDYEAAMARFKEAQKEGATDAQLAPMRAELLRMAGEVNVGGAGPNVVAAYLRLKNPLVIDYTGKHTATAGEGFAEIVKRAKAAGHDGVFFKNVDDTITSGRRSNVYAVFDAENIRSAMDLREPAAKTTPKIELEAPAPAKPQTKAEQLRAKHQAERQAEKARMAATGERQRGRVESWGEEKADDAPPAPTKPVFDREKARAAVAKEVVPLKAGADTTRAMNKMLDEIEGILALQTKRGEPDLQGALREWVRSKNIEVPIPGQVKNGKPVMKTVNLLPGIKTSPAELADRILRKVEGRSLTDTAENRVAARQEVRQPSVVENERIAKKAASEEATGDNLAADDYAVTKQDFAESEAAARGEDAPAEEDASTGVQVYKPELAAERVSTKNTERVAADLLYELRQGLKSPEEAAVEYGGPAETGRKRKNAEFVDYLEKQIAHYGDPKTVEAVMRDLAAAEKKRLANRGDVKSKQDDTAAVQRLLREYEMTSADSLDMLRAAAKKLRDADTRAEVAAEIATKQAEKKAEKKALADEAKQVGVSAATMQKLRQMVSTAERQADVKAMLAVEDLTRRSGFTMTDLAKQMGYDPQAWLAEHQHRMLGKGEPDAERARMYDAVFETSNRRMEELDREREKLARYYGSDLARVEKAQERFDVRDEDLQRAYAWLAENYGTPAIRANIGPLVDSMANRALAKPVNDLLRDSGQRLGLHTMLDRVASDTAIQEQAPGLARLAKLLRGKVPDLEVMTEAQLRARYTIPDGLFNDMIGAYIPRGRVDSLVMMTRHDTAHITAVHEALHAATDHFITNNPDAPEVMALERIRQELLNTDVATYLKNIEGGQRGRIDYAATDVHETLTLMMTDPTVKGSMAKTKASAQFIEDMRALGIDPTVGRPSMWNVLVDWVKKVVGVDPHKDGLTMLDFAMRTGLRTIRAADEWNSVTPDIWQAGFSRIAASRIRPNKAVPDDPVGRELATTARGAVNRVVSAADLPGMGDKARAAVLQAATTDSIVEWNRKLAEPSDRLGVKGNPLVRLRDALEDITGVARRYHEQHADTVGELADRLRSKAGQDVAQLMNDATLAEVRLGTRDAEANAHLTTPEQQDALREIQGRYDALSDEAKKLYQDTRAYYETTYRAERKERLDALIDAVMPEATEDQRTAILKALRTRAGTEALLTKGDAHVEAAFGNDWTAHRALVRGVAQVHKMGFVRGDYFPLRRYGDYVLRYGSGEEGNYGVEMFARRGEAEARRAELAAQGVADLTQVMDRRESKLRDLLPNSPIADEIERAVTKNPALRGHAEAVRDVVNQVLLEHATRSERVRTQFRRKGVAGAAVDPSRVLASEYLASGYRMGHIKHGFDRARALSDLQLVVDDLGRHGGSGEQIRLSQVKKEMEQRLATGDDAQSFFSGFARRATTLGYIQSLMSPSHMVTNTIGVWNNAMPMIGARHGAVAASAQLARASAQVAPKVLGQGARNFFNALGKGLKAADWRMSHLARDRLIAAGANKEHMTRLFEALDHVGLIDHTQDRELQNIANANRVSTTGVGKLWQRFMDLNAAGAHAVDVMNKSAVAKAAFDLEFRKTGDVQGAIDYAMETLRKAHPNYNLSNRSRISTNKGSLGQFGAPIMQFKAYGLHMYGVLANLTKQSMHGASTAERREARLALAGIIATHAAAAGVVNTIADPLRYIGGAWDWITGAPRPRDYQSDVRNFIADIFGPELGEVVSRGLPRLAGIDLSNRVGLGNMLAVPELESFDSKGMVKMVGLALMGASGQDAAEIGAGVAKMFQGDVAGGAQQALPRVFRDAMKAYRLSDKGATGPRSQVIIPAEQLSMADIVAQAAGFQPAKVAEAREARQAISTRMMEAREARTRLATKWLEADPADRSALMDDIRDYNQKNPGFTLTVAQLLQMQRDRGKAAKQDFGLRVPPKAGYLRQDARFANVER